MVLRRRPDRAAGWWCSTRPPASRALGDVDVVFPALHGAYGEDGTIQGLLEMAGVPVRRLRTSSRRAAAMDKEFTKKLAAAGASRSGRYAVLRRRRASLSEADRERLGLPVFVKPARAGSSYRHHQGRPTGPT